MGAPSTVTELGTGTAASQPTKSPTFLPTEHQMFQPAVLCYNSSQEKPSFWSARFCPRAHEHNTGLISAGCEPPNTPPRAVGCSPRGVDHTTATLTAARRCSSSPAVMSVLPACPGQLSEGPNLFLRQSWHREGRGKKKTERTPLSSLYLQPCKEYCSAQHKSIPENRSATARPASGCVR